MLQIQRIRILSTGKWIILIDNFVFCLSKGLLEMFLLTHLPIEETIGRPDDLSLKLHQDIEISS